jgi:HEAT repeat protein
MVSKAYIRHAFKLYGVRMVGFMIGILGFVMILNLILDVSDQTESEQMIVTPAIKENTKDVQALAEEESVDKAAGAVTMLKVTTPGVPKSEAQNSNAGTRREETSGVSTETTPGLLVYKAESAFAGDFSAEEKLAAIRRLEAIDDPIVLDAVMIAMDDPDPDLRKAALEVLRDMDNEEINEAFLAGLEDDNQEVTEKAMDIMADSDSPTILPSLEQALLDSDEKIQRISMLTLEDISDPRAVDILIETGLLNHNESIREKVLDSLEFIIGRRFETYQDAKIWWELNRDNFEFD